MSPLLFAFFGMPGHLELLIIAAIVLLLFGHRLPSVMRSLGSGITQFKAGLRDAGEDMEEAPSGEKKIKDE